MRFMNEYDVQDAAARYGYSTELPNLRIAARTLVHLMSWTNDNSDGWCYWRKPVNAAAKLMALIESVDRYDPADCTAAELKAALTPIKAFLTRQGVPHAHVLVDLAAA